MDTYNGTGELKEMGDGALTAREYDAAVEQLLRHQRREMGAALSAVETDPVRRARLWRAYSPWQRDIPSALRGEVAPCVECGEWAPLHGQCPDGHQADATRVSCPEGCDHGDVRHAEVDASGCWESEPCACDTCGGVGTIPADETDEGWLRIYFLRALAHVRAHGFDLKVRR